MQTLIDQMTAALAQLDAQREALAAAIAALQGASGAPTSEKPGRVAKPRPAPRRGRRETTEAATARGDTARPPDALSEAAIRTALKNGHDTAAALEASTKLPTWKLRALLRQMKAAGTVRTTGATSGLRYRLTT